MTATAGPPALPRDLDLRPLQLHLADAAALVAEFVGGAPGRQILAGRQAQLTLEVAADQLDRALGALRSALGDRKLQYLADLEHIRAVVYAERWGTPPATATPTAAPTSPADDPQGWGYSRADEDQGDPPAAGGARPEGWPLGGRGREAPS